MKEGDPVTAIDVLAEPQQARKCVVTFLTVDSSLAVAIMPKCSADDHSDCVSTTGRTQHGYITWCYPQQEGRTWARGWDTKEAAALIVAHALAAL